MKKVSLIALMTCTLLCAKAQNLFEHLNTGNNKPGDEVYLGTDNLWHVLPIGKPGNIQVVGANGLPAWADPTTIATLKGAPGAAGAIGPAGPTGPAGAPGTPGAAGVTGPAGQSAFASLPGQAEGSTPAFINGQWIAVPASYNIGFAKFQNLTTSYILDTPTAPADGNYTISLTISPSQITTGSSIAAVVTYTDMSGISQTIPATSFPPVTTQSPSSYSAIHITCKMGTLITVQTVLTGSATYTAGDIIHQIN